MKIQDVLIINIVILLILIIGFLVIDLNLLNNITIKLPITLILSGIILFNGYIFYLKDKEEYKKAGSKFLLINIDKNIFKNDKEFKQYVYDNYCQCINQCIDMNLYKTEESNTKDSGYCSKITRDKINNFLNYDLIIHNAISYLIHKGLLIRSGTRFYIKIESINLKFTWENIKKLPNIEDQKLFWLLRKLIVDSLLKRILLKSFKNQNISSIYSVGSTKITSDYDITLYGLDADKVIIIQEFQKLFKRFFTDDSSLVFDTNIYGKAYIYYSSEGFNNEIIQNHEDIFYYLKSYYDNKYKFINLNSQLIWGIIKFLKDLSNSFDEKINNDYIDFLKNKLQYPLFNLADNILLFLNNQDTEKINYNNLIMKSQEISNIYYNKLNLDNINDITIIKEHDLTALINFYGTETYYSRGAFLDTVVNQQMLTGKNKLKLLDIEYVTSILENSGFYFIHNNKSKYIIRVKRTLEELINNYSAKYNILSDDLNKLNNIINKFKIDSDYDTKYCKWISNENSVINILNCEKYNIFNIIFNLIFNILKITSKEYNTDNIPFSNLFISQQNSIFELDKSSRSKSYIFR